MREFERKRLLIMGGMRITCEIVRKAQEMGIYTIVADYNKIEDSPAKQIADKAVPEFKTPAFNVSCLCALGTIMDITGTEEVKSLSEV